MRPIPRPVTAGVLTGVLVAALTAAAPATAAPPAHGTRQAAFATAARESGVPSTVLLAVSYNETLWEAHHGVRSSTGAYGPMALTDAPAGATGQRGDGRGAPADGPTLHTLTAAAALLHAPAATLRTDDAANIRGGAALLASYAKSLGHGKLPADAGGWYPAVARYAGAAERAGASAFADDVFSTVRSGASRHTQDGQDVALPATPSVRPDTAGIAALGLPSDTEAAGQKAECPPGLDCNYIPAAYQQDDPNDPGNYGNYDIANRPATMPVRYIVIHDTEETYDQAVAHFEDPKFYVSAHYVVDGTRGLVTQMVRTKDVAWHAGNWYINSDAIGIEQQGWATQGPTWFTEKLYRTTSRLVAYLAARYHVPVDRAHIIGHDNVPGIAPAYVKGMHWDPGPYWDWNHFMDLIAWRPAATANAWSSVVRINPRFTTNIQRTRDCEQNVDLAPMASSIVWLHTAPSDTAPLFSDPGLHTDGSAGTNCTADWGDKASAGQLFSVADRQGDWLAIWWDGAKVWLHNPRSNPVVTPAWGLVVKPKPGLASVPTFGVAYPDASDYPKDISPVTGTPLQYTIQAGQSYVYTGDTPTNYYYAPTINSSLPDDHTNVVGKRRYLEIQLGHRIGFVRADDVQLVPAA